MTRPSLLPYRGGVHGQGVLCRHFSALPRLLAARIRLQVSPGPAAMGQTPLESGGRFFRFQRERFLYSRKRSDSQACLLSVRPPPYMRFPFPPRAAGGGWSTVPVSGKCRGGGMRRNGPGEFLRFWLLAPVAGGGKGQRPTEDT